MPHANPLVHIVVNDGAGRYALAFLLTNAGYALSLHETCGDFLAQTDRNQRAVLVVDVHMPGADGLELMETIKTAGRDVGVILISGQTDVSAAVAAMKAGAVDFLQKPFSDDDLLRAVEAAYGRAPHGDGQAGQGSCDSRLQHLSRREREVLDALVEGLPNKLIADRLSISPRTVEIYRANLRTKLNVKSLPQLVRLAVGHTGGLDDL